MTLTGLHETGPELNAARISVALNHEEQSQPRILIVDDEPTIRDLFAFFLSEHYSCVTAGDAQEALARLAGEEFALVISDVNMPGLSGVELLRKVVERHPETVVIMVSAMERTQRVLDTLRLGAFDYLIKPCDLDVLALSVERALEQGALVRMAKRYKQDLEEQNRELVRRKQQLERLQTQLVHSEKMASLGQLAAGVAHELNNPAGFIYGNMEMLGESIGSLRQLLDVYAAAELGGEASAHIAALKSEIAYDALLDDLDSIIGDAQSGAERIRDIVQNLRTFSRLDEAEFKKTDIHEGIESTLRLLARFYTSGNIGLNRHYANLPPVDCYAGQLNQVWMNLLANAAHAVHSKAGGKVTITTGLEPDAIVKITIADAGCGIAPENLSKIFDPFFTTKPVGEGTGLGLSITYAIIERHNGSIKVESRVGVGTTFTIRLPVHAHDDGERAKSQNHLR